jgi:hypothetical protein
MARVALQSEPCDVPRLGRAWAALGPVGGRPWSAQRTVVTETQAFSALVTGVMSP